MNDNGYKNTAIIVSLIILITAVLVEGLPYGFFTFLRWVVSGTAAYLTWFSLNYEKRGFPLIMGVIAILFNPIVPIYLTRDLWKIIDLVVAAILLVSFFALKLPRDFNASKSA